MSTHNIGFLLRNKKKYRYFLVGKSALSRAMHVAFAVRVSLLIWQKPVVLAVSQLGWGCF